MPASPLPHHSALTRRPPGHFRLDATHLRLQDLAPLLRCLHQGCPHCRVVFLTPTGPQVFSVADAEHACSLVRCSRRGG